MGSTITPQPSGVDPDAGNFESPFPPGDVLGHTLRWTERVCANFIAGPSVRSSAWLPPPGMGQGLNYGDSEAITMHPIRSVRPAPIDDFANKEKCFYQLGGFMLLPNGDTVAAFCGQPDGGTSSPEHVMLALPFMQQGVDANRLCREGDSHFLGACKTPFWVDGHFDSEAVACGPPFS